MPTFTRSALNPNGMYQPDAMDQVEQWNANRGDQWSRYALDMLQRQKAQQQEQAGEDWRRDVALKQLNNQMEMFQGGRADAAAARQSDADRWQKQFDYLGGRDQLADKRWQSEFEQSRLDREEARAARGEQMGRQREEYEANKPLRAAQLEMVQAELERMRREREARDAASGVAAYVPKTDKGQEVYTTTLAATGNKMQAGMAAKAAEREQAMMEAEAAKSPLAASLQDFSANDKAMIGWDPTEQDKAAMVAKIEAYAALLRNAGMTEPQIAAAVQDLLRQTLTSGGRTDWNAGNSEYLLQRFGGTFR